MAVKAPQGIFETVCSIGCAKAKLPRQQQLVLGFLAGAFIAFGGLLAIVVGKGSPALAATNPGLASLLFAGVFPVGLMLVVVVGAELFTGNCGVMIPSCLTGGLGWRDMLRGWFYVYLGNFAGAIFAAVFLAYWSKVINVNAGGFAASLGQASVAIAETKVNMGWSAVLLRGIGANWLVCLAIGLAVASDDLVGKIWGIWFPIMAFVAIGFEHSIANMFFIPLGMLNGASVNVTQFLWNNLVPSTIGNIIGGAIFVGGIYWWVYGRDPKQPQVAPGPR